MGGHRVSLAPTLAALVLRAFGLLLVPLGIASLTGILKKSPNAGK